ncbi:MAG: hypothetical protein HY809_03885 [Nitrospirae bacterium]|nr:hypothetical protein [Nitrospirota bacterium]
MFFNGSADEYFLVLENYYSDISPFMALAYALVGLTLLFLFKDDSRSKKLISLLLALSWFWSGAVYHLKHFTLLSNSAYLFAFIFFLQGGLILWHGILLRWFGILTPRLSYRAKPNVFSAVGILYVSYVIVIHPLASYYFIFGSPGSPVFGISPSTITIFTIGVFLFADRRVPRRLLIIPVLWAAASFIISIQMGIKEDIILLAAGIAGAILVVLHNRKIENVGVKIVQRFPS